MRKKFALLDENYYFESPYLMVTVSTLLLWISRLNVKVNPQTRSAHLKEILMRRIYDSHRKRPHVLPPLPDLQPSVLRPMDPLQPPDLLLMENRSGSPAPKPNVPRESDYDYNGNDGQPVIKISDLCRKECERQDSMKVDLLTDPIFTEPTDLLHKLQKRNSARLSGFDLNHHDRENSYPDNFSRNQMQILPGNLEKRRRSLTITPMEISDNRKSVHSPDLVHIPNRYTPLKPIGQGVIENDLE